MTTHTQRSLVWVLAERGVQVALAMAVSAVVARTYGPASFGSLQTYLALASAWASVGLICSAEVLMPRYASGDPRYQTIFGFAFIIRGAAALLAAAGFVYQVGGDQNMMMALPLMAIVLLNEPFAALGAYFQTRGLQKIWSLARLAGLFLKCVLILALCVLHIDPRWVTVPYALEAGVVAAFIAYRYIRDTGPGRFDIDKAVAKEILQHGFVMGVGLIAMVWLQKLDRIHLSQVASAEVQGYYGAAMQLTENWFFCATLLVQAIGGTYIFRYSGAEQKRRVGVLAGAFAGVSTLGWVIGLLTASTILPLIFGSDYGPSAGYLTWQLGVSILYWTDVAFSTGMLARRATSMVVCKWTLALGAAWLVQASGIALGPVPDPIQIPLVGYATALVFSTLYYCFWRHEEPR